MRHDNTIPPRLSVAELVRKVHEFLWHYGFDADADGIATGIEAIASEYDLNGARRRELEETMAEAERAARCGAGKQVIHTWEPVYGHDEGDESGRRYAPICGYVCGVCGEEWDDERAPIQGEPGTCRA